MIDPAAVRAHVDKILASPGFVNSDRLRRLLDFTVQACLNGESSQLKEEVLGREVFDRDAAYDPRTDPIVRIEVRHLRQRLDEYYAGPGRGEPLRVEYSEGAYVPVVHAAETAPLTHRPARLILAAAAIAVVVAAGAYYLWRPAAPANAVAIVPARWTLLDPAGLDPTDEPLAEAITAQVASRGRIPVIEWSALLPFRRQPRPSRDLAKTTGATLVLAVSVRGDAAQSHVTVFLVEPFTGRKRWAEDFYAQDLQTPDAIRTLARTIAGDLELTLGIRE